MKPKAVKFHQFTYGEKRHVGYTDQISEICILRLVLPLLLDKPLSYVNTSLKNRVEKLGSLNQLILLSWKIRSLEELEEVKSKAKWTHQSLYSHNFYEVWIMSK